MSNEIYYTVEKIRKSPQGYTFFISSSMGTKFEMLVSNEQYERFDIAEGERIDDEHFLKTVFKKNAHLLFLVDIATVLHIKSHILAKLS